MPGEGFPQMLVQTFSSNKPNDLKFHHWNYICSNPFYSFYIHNCIMIFLKPFNKLFYKFFVQKAVAALCWSSHEEIPHTQWQRRNPSKMVGGANLHLESNPTPARDAQRAQTYLVHPGTPQRLRQTCVWASSVEVSVSSGLPQGQGLWLRQTWVWHEPSWRRSPLTPP